MSIELISMSSKGQIVLPISMRKSLSLKTGDKLAVYSSNGVIMLKPVKIPTVDDFAEWLVEAQEWAASVGYEESDVDDVIKSARERKRNENRH